MIRFQLPPRDTFTANSSVDPFRFYYRPLVGRLFSARLDAGLELLPPRFERLVELGYGAGLLLPTLARVTNELYGIDREPAPPRLDANLAALGVRPRLLVRGEVTQLPWPASYFDGVVAFSILEHLQRPALEQTMAEVARVLVPGGRFLVGCPAVHKAMNAAFWAIGFGHIEDHHVSGMPAVLAASRPYFTVEKRAAWPRVLGRAPLGWAPYNVLLLQKKP